MTRIVQLSDIHFGVVDRRALDLAQSFITDQRPDGLVICGDLTQRGAHDEFTMAADWLADFDCPVACVPGNHDTPLLNLAHRVGKPFTRYHRYLGHLPSSLQVEGFAAFGLNTARGWQARRNWAEGSVNLADLTARLSEADKCPAGTVSAVMAHHPFLSPPKAPLRVATRRGRRAHEALGRSSVDLLLAGHVHVPTAGIRETPEGSYVEVICGTLSHRLRNHPPGFNVIDLEEDTISVTAVLMDGSASRELPLGRYPRGG